MYDFGHCSLLVSFTDYGTCKSIFHILVLLASTDCSDLFLYEYEMNSSLQGKTSNQFT